MKKTILALSLAALSVPALAQGKKPEPEYTITGNVGVFSDYRFRGISQTRLAPALQGGFDLAHKSGLYVGNWNSNVSGEQYINGAGLEMDLYGGFKTSIAGIGLDLGTIYYFYPGAFQTAGGADKYDNHEVYLGVSWGPVSFKTHYALTDYFGLKAATDDASGINRTTGGSKNTLYYDLTLSYEIAPKLTGVFHAGRTDYKNYADFNYYDYKIGVTYDMDGWILGLSYFTNTFDNSTLGKGFNTNAPTAMNSSKNLYKNGAVFSLTKTF